LNFENIVSLQITFFIFRIQSTKPKTPVGVPERPLKKINRVVIKKSIHAPQVLNEPIEYHKSFSRGMRVEMGGFSMLFISGTASIDGKGKTRHEKDLAAQSKRVFTNISALLASEGATWHDVVQTRCYLKTMRDYGLFNQARNAFYKQQKIDPFPASVCIEANLCRPELLVEIEAVAVLKNVARRTKRK
jgi:2-iminobutanoate/2-iminopropanoate deaminase